MSTGGSRAGGKRRGPGVDPLERAPSLKGRPGWRGRAFPFGGGEGGGGYTGACSAVGTTKAPPGRGRPLLSPHLTPTSRRGARKGPRPPSPGGVGAGRPRLSRWLCHLPAAGDPGEAPPGNSTCPAAPTCCCAPPSPAVPAYLRVGAPRPALPGRPGRAERPAPALRRLRLSGKPRRCPARRPGAAPLWRGARGRPMGARRREPLTKFARGGGAERAGCAGCAGGSRGRAAPPPSRPYPDRSATRPESPPGLGTNRGGRWLTLLLHTKRSCHLPEPTPCGRPDALAQPGIRGAWQPHASPGAGAAFQKPRSRALWPFPRRSTPAEDPCLLTCAPLRNLLLTQLTLPGRVGCAAQSLP
jgi:hypothetical protein